MEKKLVCILVVMLMIGTAILPVIGTGNISNINENEYDLVELSLIVHNELDLAIDSSDSGEICSVNDPYVIYEGLHWQLTITVRWDPPNPEKPICLWVDTATLPVGATFPECVCGYGEVSGVLDWTPSFGQAGTYQIVFYVGESCYEPIGYFTVTVIVYPYNPDPQDTFEIYEGQDWHLIVTAYWVPPQEKLICLWVDTATLPYGATFVPECHCDYGQVTSDLYWTPSIGQAGEYIIIFYAGETCGEYVFPFSILVIVYPVQEDTIPPTTTKAVGEPQYDEGCYVTSETSFTLTAEDNPGGSGVDYIAYRDWYNGNWSDWIVYTESFILTGEGPHYLEYYSVDKEENVEAIHNQTHIVDDTPPISYPWKYPLWAWYVPEKWALICASWDDDGYWFLANALQAYNVLKNHGYDDEHIILILCHNTQGVVNLDKNNVNLLNGPDGIAGNADDPVIDLNIPLPWPFNRFGMKGALALGIWYLSQKVEEDDEVLLYLVNHGDFKDPGNHFAYYCFEDGGNVREDEFAKWVDMIDCYKLVVIGDFCFSGCFLDNVNSCPPNKVSGINKPFRILISSTGTNCANPNKTCDCCVGWGYTTLRNPAQAGDYAGSDFGFAFWKAIDAGRSYNGAFQAARRHVPPGEANNVGTIQDPRLVDKSGTASWNSPTDWENVLPGYGWVDFHPWDQGGISYGATDPSYTEYNSMKARNWGEDNRRGEPVGVQSTYYRVWYNKDWTQWIEYTGSINFGGEGIHYFEWYSVDYLGNTEEITNHTIYVDITAPPTPSLISPSNGETTYTTPTFDWTDVEDASDEYYTLQVATDSALTNIALEKTKLVLSEYSIMEEDALSNGEYHWRVKAVDGLSHSGEWSEIWSFSTAEENSAPEKPNKPTGPKKGSPGGLYAYSSSTTDVNGDHIRYIFDWGDGTQDITNWYNSDDTVNALHIWEDTGSYSVKVKAEDDHGYESEWSDPLVVSMPKNKSYINIFFLRFLGDHPHMFPLLRQLLGL